MGFGSVVNYIVYDNPISKATITLFQVTHLKFICHNFSSLFQGQKTIAPPSVTVITDKTPLWKLASETGPFIRIAGVMGASAVILGAYGAHRTYPKDRAQELKAVFETANRFHFFHTLALFGVPMCRNPKLVSIALY